MMEKKTDNFGIKDIKKGLKDIFRHSSEYKNEFVVIFILIALSSAISAVSPYIWGLLIDAINAKTLVHIEQYAILKSFIILAVYILLLLVSIFLNLRVVLKSTLVEEEINTTYLARAYRHVFKLPMAFHKGNKAGDTSEKIRAAANGIDNIFSNSILGSLPDLVTAIIMYIIVFFLRWQIGIVISFTLVGYIYFSVKEIKPTLELQKQSRKSYRKASSVTQDALTNIKAVKDFNTEEREFEHIRSTYKDEAMKVWYRLFSIQEHTGSMQAYIRMAVQGFVMAISIYSVSKGLMTIGELLAYNTYALMIFSPLSSIISSWRNIQNGIVAIEDAEVIFEMPTEKYIPEDAQQADIHGKIVFNQVSFHYDTSAPVLSNLNFVVEPGETVALVGESGVGKSTLIDLLSGYYFATEGTISFGGTDIRKINLGELRANIAVVTQEISLFNDTIENNLKYGNPDATFEEVKEAARKAHCIDFIERFPEKWQQVVGERGLKLSVGQKQRVAIARAILKNPAVLILDEPTSALDAGSEKIITDSLDELMKQKTTFIVAHRLSTVRKADKIFVFKQGKIIEQGKHDELLKIEGGEYKRLYELQIGLHK